MDDFLERQQKRLTKTLGVFGILFIVMLGVVYFASSPDWFRGEVLEQLGDTEQTGSADFFVAKNYTAAPGQVGEIELKANKQMSINGIQFTLKFNKTALEAQAVATDGTPFQGFITTVNTDNPLGATVVLASANPVTMAAGEAIPITVRVDSSVSSGTEIDIDVVDVSLIDSSLAEVSATVESGKITVSGSAISDDSAFIESVDPKSVTFGESTTITISGRNLGGASVFLNNTELSVSSATSSSVKATVPAETAAGVYQLTVTNSAGETFRLANAVVVSEISDEEITIHLEDSQMVPSQIPNDGVTEALLTVAVSDPRGVGDIDRVTVDLTAIEGPSITPMVASGTKEGMAIYTLPIVIPPTVPATPEPYSLPIFAVNKSGDQATATMTITVYVDLAVLSEEAFTTPRIAVNDEETPVTLFVPIAHSIRNPLSHVLVNLGTIARVGEVQTGVLPTTEEGAPAPAPVEEGAPPPVSGAPVISAQPNVICPTNSDTIVCMDITAQAGHDRTVATLPGVLIRKQIAASSDPYVVQVTATDINGQTAEGFVPITVQDPGNIISDDRAPTLDLAVGTAPDKVELVFSEPMDANTLSPDGSNFTITFEDDISIGLSVIDATINADGNTVTLTTGPQEPGRYYAVEADTLLTDVLGIPLVRGTRSKIRFIGFEDDALPPRLDYATPTSPNTLELEFHRPLRPSTLELTFAGEAGRDPATTRGSFLSRPGKAQVRIQDAVTGEDLPVHGVRFGSDGRILIVDTDTQRATQKYFVNVRDIASFAGVFVKTSGVTKFFKGFQKQVADATELLNQADFNQDGKVDFLDFTIFATFYGKAFAEDIDPDAPAPAIEQPGASPLPVAPGEPVPGGPELPGAPPVSEPVVPLPPGPINLPDEEPAPEVPVLPIIPDEDPTPITF